MKRYRWAYILVAAAACGDSSSSNPDDDAGSDAADDTDDAGAASDASIATEAGAACSALSSQQSRVACAANALLATLPATQLSGVNMELSDYTSRSKWSNLPVQMKPRAGVQLGSLSATSQTAALELMNIALNDQGRTTLTGVLRADDYLATMQGGYGSDLYSIAIFGTPSETGDFEVMFGGHHMAYNLHFAAGKFYPVPLHLGCEPKSAFTVAGGTYEPLTPMGDAMFAIFEALDTTQRSSSYLSGQTFSDVVVNPDLDYGKGAGRTSKAAYPTGSNRRGVIVADMTSAQQALVTASIEHWVRQYPSEVADALMTDYRAGYADTYFAWAGNASGADKDVTGTYLRIDGPRVWIELAVQGGIVIRGQTHYHTIYHDKVYDYAGQF